MSRLLGRLAVPEAVRFRRLGDEAVLLHLTTGTYFSLDSTGTRMWEALTASADRSSALEQLLGLYNIDRQQLSEDLDALINELVEHQLLERVDR